MRGNKWVVSLLVIVLLLALAACSSNGKTSSEKSSAPGGSASSEAKSTTDGNADEATTKPKEKITLKIYGPGIGLAVPTGIQDDPIAKEIERVTGIKMDLDMNPDDNKFNAMLASGDLPDLMLISPTKGGAPITYLKPLIENGSILPLDELIEKYAPNLKAMDKYLQFSRDQYSNGTGKLYALPSSRNPTPDRSPGWGPTIRWDYYAELGYPEIKSGDDWLNVVEAMVKKHPTTEDGKKVYGFSIHTDWGYNTPIRLMGASVKSMEGIGQTFDIHGFLDNRVQTNEWISQLDPDAGGTLFTGAEFLNKAYRRGLLDPDSFTQKWDNLLEKGTAGRVLSAQFDWILWPFNSEHAKEGKGFRTLKMNSKVVPYTSNAPMGVSDWLWVVPAKSKSPERAVELLNYIFSYEGARTIWSGIKGTHWIEKDGKLYVPDEMVKAQESDPNWTLTSGITKYGNMAGLNAPVINPNDGYPMKLWKNQYYETLPEMTPLDQDYTKHYGIRSMDNQLDYLEVYTYNELARMLMPTPPEEIKEIDSKISTYLSTAMFRLIMSKTEADFEKGKQDIAKEANRLGIEKSNEFWKKAYETGIELASKYQ